MTPNEVIEKLGLRVTAQFVPFSKSRNAKEAKTANDLSLNWRVTIQRGGKPFMTADYMQGIGHAPAYKASVRKLGHTNSLMRFEALLYEAENGRDAPRGNLRIGGRPLNPPTVADVLYSLTSDASALDFASFEDWASDFGYDTDSREAERVYKACLETALKLRAAIGDAGLEQLRNVFQDY